MATNKKIPKCPPLRFPQFNDQWKFATISEVCKTSTGSMNTQDKIEGGAYPFYVRSSTIERANKYTYDGIAILTPGDGAIGKVFHYSEGKIAVHQRVYILSDITIGTKYLFYYFADKFYNRVIRMSAKNTVDSVRMNMITDMPISLPSLAEQEKIASFLSLIDERIESCSETIKERKREKVALLNQLFSQKLRFPQFSDEWQQITLGEICTIKTGKLDANAMIEGGRYPFFTCAKQTYQTDTYSFSGEAILVAGNGDVGLTKYYNGKFNAYQRTYVLQSLRRDIILRLIRNYIDHALPKRIVSLLNGSAMPYITLSTLRDMPISLPSLAEQKKIADFLSLIDERIEVEEELLKQYEMQKKYLLRLMFI